MFHSFSRSPSTVSAASVFFLHFKACKLSGVAVIVLVTVASYFSFFSSSLECRSVVPSFSPWLIDESFLRSERRRRRRLSVQVYLKTKVKLSGVLQSHIPFRIGLIRQTNYSASSAHILQPSPQSRGTIFPLEFFKVYVLIKSLEKEIVVALQLKMPLLLKTGKNNPAGYIKFLLRFCSDDRIIWALLFFPLLISSSALFHVVQFPNRWFMEKEWQKLCIRGSITD